MVSLVTFDLDDTLWDNEPVIEKAIGESYLWLLKRCPELSCQHDAQSLDAFHLQLMASRPDLAHRVSQARIVAARMALESVGYEAPLAATLAEEFFAVFMQWRHRITLFAGVEEMLATMASRYVLAVITNGNVDVERIGLGKYFSFSVKAEDINRSKPDATLFRHALSQAGITADRAVHVGDNCIADVQGAAAAGMKTVWFNPQRETWEGVGAPDVAVTSCKDIPAAISRIDTEAV